MDLKKPDIECLTRHDVDAVLCKHCGVVLHITTEGSDGSTAAVPFYRRRAGLTVDQRD